MSFDISNQGSAVLSGDILETCPEFSIVAGEGPFSLGPDQSMTVIVRFTPPDGVFSCTIQTGTPFCPDVVCVGAGQIGLN
jgi:hypothetical protein